MNLLSATGLYQNQNGQIHTVYSRPRFVEGDFKYVVLSEVCCLWSQKHLMFSCWNMRHLIFQHFMLFSVCLVSEWLYLSITSNINKQTEPRLHGMTQHLMIYSHCDPWPHGSHWCCLSCVLWVWRRMFTEPLDSRRFCYGAGNFLISLNPCREVSESYVI